MAQLNVTITNDINNIIDNYSSLNDSFDEKVELIMKLIRDMSSSEIDQLHRLMHDKFKEVNKELKSAIEAEKIANVHEEETRTLKGETAYELIMIDKKIACAYGAHQTAKIKTQSATKKVDLVRKILSFT